MKLTGKMALSIISTVFLFSGCSTRMLNQKYNRYSEKAYKTIKQNKDSLKNEFKKDEKIIKKKYVDLSTSKDLSTVLNELGRINDRVYMLQNQNITIPKNINSKLIHITNFNNLKRYIEDTTNYTIKIISNKFIKDRVKKVKVINKSAAKAGFDEIKFKVNGKESISSALSRIGTLLGYSISYDRDLTDQNNIANNTPNNTNTNQNDFRKQDVVFNGNSVSDFLNFIEQNFNVYCDVDYNKKIISIKKYKTKIFNIIALNYKTQQTLSNNGITSNSSSQSSQLGTSQSAASNTAKQTITSDIMTTLKNNITNLLDKDTESKVTFSKESGTVMVRTTNQNMQEIKKYINRINSIYAKQVKITVSIYEFVLNRKYNIGTDLSDISKSLNFKTSNLSKSILKYTNTHSGHTIGANLNLNNDFMRYAKSYIYTQIFMNDIAKNMVIQNSQDYIKSITATTTTNTATTTSKNINIATVTDGTNINILPKIIGNKISLNIYIKINSINQLSQVSDGAGGTIYLPDIDEKNIPSQIIMTSGEKRLVGAYQTYQDVKTYNGVAPIEDFIIAGKSGKKFIKKEIFIVLEAKILK